jgi:hypothetical protein
VKRKQQHVCVYRNLFDAVHKSGSRSTRGETKLHTSSNTSNSSDSDDQPLIKYADGWSSSDESKPSFFIPTIDPELDALCFFFNNYVNVPREAQTNIFVEHVLPLWRDAADDSPIKVATSAVAANLSQLWRKQGADSGLARSQYAKAVTALRNSFQDPNLVDSDEVLGCMFMLDFYESANRRYHQEKDVDIHQKAAMALIKSRGVKSFKTETSRRLVTAMRARYILHNLQARKRVDLDDDLLSEEADFDLPPAKLDLICADLANVMHEGSHLLDMDSVPLPLGYQFSPESSLSPESDNSFDIEMSLEMLLSYLLEINLRLNAWRNSLPISWEPYRIPDADSTLHYSIRAVGLYNGLCDVYASIETAHCMNAWRSTKVLVLRLISHCVKHLDPFSPSKYILTPEELNLEIQTFVDDICATVPFCLGSRTTLSLPHEHQEYPPVPPFIRAQANYVDSHGQPAQMTDSDHIRVAAAMGGWFILSPLTAMMRYATPPPPHQSTDFKLDTLKIRPGQWEWLRGQVKRIHKIYRMPFPQVQGQPPGNKSTPITSIGGNGFMVDHSGRNWVPA